MNIHSIVYTTCKTNTDRSYVGWWCALTSLTDSMGMRIAGYGPTQADALRSLKSENQHHAIIVALADSELARIA